MDTCDSLVPLPASEMGPHSEHDSEQNALPRGLENNAPSVSGDLSSFAGAVHRLSGVNNRNLFLHSSGG